MTSFTYIKVPRGVWESPNLPTGYIYSRNFNKLYEKNDAILHNTNGKKRRLNSTLFTYQNVQRRARHNLFAPGYIYYHGLNNSSKKLGCNTP